MATAEYEFTEEEMSINQNIGFPKAYAKLCRDRNFGPYSHGPPFTFTPYILHQNEVMREMELDKMFPVIDPKAKPTTKPKIFLSLLWKQLNHLGNAGFDPTVIRVDPYGNVLYYHADPASPLAWDIDHWFPCSRGGLTVPSNLRILQWQVHKRKHNKLEFLIPWWDLQLGISVNQFLSIFASSNSDFRHRAFSFLFSEGETEELNASQTVDSHNFHQHFIEMAEEVGLAPAAIVASQRETYEASFALKSLDYNRQLRPRSPAMAARKVKSILKENENPDLVTNPYQAIVMARNSLKEREDASKIQGEIQKLDEEVNELKRKNEEEKLTIQDLELVLVKRRRRAEKCRRLAEAQSSYRTVLEKMIRDAMHQSVVYKEQVRLSQAASNALMARLEAQKAICDASEKELHRRYKQRDDIEKQIRPGWEQARKRSRMYDTLSEDGDNKPVLYLPGIKPRTPSHKELRVFLEEQKALEDGIALNEEEPQQEEIEEEPQKPVIDIGRKKPEEHNQSIVALEDENSIEHKLRTLDIGEGMKHNGRFPVLHESEKEEEEDEESRKQRGKGNVEKWLQMLLENTQEDLESQNIDENGTTRIDQLVRKLDSKHPQKIKILKCPVSKDKEGGVKQKLHGANKLQVLQEKDGGKKQEEIIETEASKTLAQNKKASEVGIGVSTKRHEDVERMEKSGKERRIVRSESARTFRRIPSSPSMILGMRKGVDCIGKKPMVTSDDDDDGDHDHAIRNKSIQSSMKKIKKVVKI